MPTLADPLSIRERVFREIMARAAASSAVMRRRRRASASLSPKASAFLASLGVTGLEGIFIVAGH